MYCKTGVLDLNNSRGTICTVRRELFDLSNTRGTICAVRRELLDLSNSRGTICAVRRELLDLSNSRGTICTVRWEFESQSFLEFFSKMLTTTLGHLSFCFVILCWNQEVLQI